MLQTVIFILVMTGLIALGFYLYRFRMQRALRRVIQCFRDHGALDDRTAMTLQELGLAPGSTFMRFYTVRNLTPYALQTLVDIDVVRVTAEQKYYLSESRLAASNLDKLLNKQPQR